MKQSMHSKRTTRSHKWTRSALLIGGILLPLLLIILILNRLSIPNCSELVSTPARIFEGKAVSSLEPTTARTLEDFVAQTIFEKQQSQARISLQNVRVAHVRARDTTPLRAWRYDGQPVDYDPESFQERVRDLSVYDVFWFVLVSATPNHACVFVWTDQRYPAGGGRWESHVWTVTQLFGQWRVVSDTLHEIVLSDPLPVRQP